MNSFTCSKKLFLFCFITLLSTTTFGQWPWDTSFPDSSATWINGRYISFFEWPTELIETDNYCLTSNDTIINELNYKIVEQCTIDYQGALRKDSTGSKVFFVPRDSTEEYLIYDFAAEVGDTLYDVYFQMGPEPGDDKFLFDIVITDLTSEFSIYLTLEYEVIDGFTGYIGLWATGMGELAGFLRPPGFYWESQPYPYESNRIACHSYRDTVRLDYNYELLGTTNGCALDMSIEEVFEEPDIQIYPNPTSNKLKCILHNNLKIEEIQIFNSLGKTVKTIRDVSHYQSEFAIDLSGLPAGLYILKVKVNNQAVNRRFVKK